MSALAVIFEKTVAVIVLMAFGGTVLPALIANGAIPTDPTDVESPNVTILFASLYVAIIGLVLARPGIARRMATASPLMTGLAALALLSTIWSLHPDVTFRRAVALCFTTLIGLHLGLRYRLEETVAVIATALGLLVALSFVFIAFVPEIGIDQEIHKGAWRGVFFQKNVTGRMVMWLVICLLWLDLVGYGAKTLVRGTLVAGLALLIMSRSGTGLVATILVALVMLAVRLLRVPAHRLIPGLAAVGLLALGAATAATVDFQGVMLLLGRDPTLTGRTELWRFATLALRDHPLEGFGYTAFWYALDGPGGYYLANWGISSVHNSWLEVMLDVGILGPIAMAAVFLRLFGGATALARYGAHRDDALAASWLVAVALGLLALSISESVFLERHSLNWVVLIVAMVRLSTSRRATRSPYATRVRHDWIPHTPS